MQQDDWRTALTTFLRPWQERPEVIGVLVTGSHAIGTNTSQSDVDVHIFLKKDCPWKERGNEQVQGYLIEYFAYPLGVYKQLEDNDYKDNQRTNIRMLATGEILFDTTGDIAKLQAEARMAMERPFAKLTPEQAEERKYWLWDSLHGLEDLIKADAPNRNLVYYSHLSLLLNVYAVFLGAEIPHLTKVHKLFTNEDFRRRYHFTAFPDQVFVDQFIASLMAPADQQLVAAQALTHHVLDKMGGFAIDGWKLRSPKVIS